MSDLPTPGTYQIDPSHSTVAFVARHLMVAKVKGRFGEFGGSITITEEPTESEATVTIQAASIDTRDAGRDEHLRSPDFLDVATHPTLEFRSTRVEPSGGDWKLHGELTVRGVTKPVVLDVDFEGDARDPWGNERIAFEAETEIDREEWGLTWNQALETGGVLVGKKVKIELDVEAVRQAE